MKIIIDESKKNPVRLRDIKGGECFKMAGIDNAEIFMKGAKKHQMSKNFFCMSMESGEIRYFDPEMLIMDLKSKLIIQ